MKRQFTISLPAVRDQVSARAHYLSMDRGAEGDPNIVLSEIIEDENQDIADQAIAQSVAQLREEMRRYFPVTIERCTDDETDNLEVSLTLPGNCDTDALHSLSDSMRGYITASVMHDWLSPIRPAEAEPYARKMAVSMADIRNALTARVRPSYENDTPVLDTIEIVYNE